MAEQATSSGFTKYQVFIIAILAILQFTVVLDFMVISPLGAILLDELQIEPSKFGLVVSGYAFSAGISGILAAGFADKYDRKKILLFFYCGFIIGTFFCGIANSYVTLLLARIFTGLFGGVIASVSMAIVTDLFILEQRGRVMGFVQMAFAVSQVLGIPFGIYLANKLNWHAPFLMIVLLSVIIGIVIVKWMKPVDKHLDARSEIKALEHLSATISQKKYIIAFCTTALLSIGGFLLMPFSSAFLVNNAKITQEELPMVFMITGICSLITLPLIGKLSDKAGKYKMFVAGSVLAMIMIVIYTNLTATPLWMVVTINAFLFAGIMSRMIPSTALMSAMPELKDRGAFMGINSSIQQIAGGIASVFSGFIVIQTAGGPLENYNIVGYIAVIIMFICMLLMYRIHTMVTNKKAAVAEKMPVSA